MNYVLYSLITIYTVIVGLFELLQYFLNHCLLSWKSVCLPHSSPLLQPIPASFLILSPPSLFLQRDCPPLPAGSSGSLATHRGPIRVGGAERKTVAGQIALWPRRAIIYCNSGPVRLKEREGEVAWRALALICLSPPAPPIIDNGWLSGDWRVGGWVLEEIKRWRISILF